MSGTTVNGTPLVEMRDMSVSFGGVHAVKSSVWWVGTAPASRP